MDQRRVFLRSSMIAGAASLCSRAALGATDEIVVGVIGTGTRGHHLAETFMRQPKCRVAAVCDVFQTNLDRTTKLLDGKAAAYKDYRRVIERKDIDAVAIATPDHWHGPMTVEACQAGKDVYVEKPISNNIEDALKMLEAARRNNRVVQVGLQQRSAPVFQEAYRVLKTGLLGRITHAHCVHPFRGRDLDKTPGQPPPGLDWEMFQGPAPRRPYSIARHRFWRIYREYGGGILTDWGVHLTDVAHWYMDLQPVRSASGSAATLLRPPDEETMPDTISVAWKYDNLIMTFGTWGAEYGNYFWGERGVLHVNRSGYSARPGSQTMAATRNPARAAPSSASQPGALAKTAFESIHKELPDDYASTDIATADHVRNFLDCMRTRLKPITGIEIGFESSLPTLLGLLATRTGRTYAWDGKAARAV
ncbi:MAG: Gfo/Idh/MocA family protein [Bryobacteraceae bacterium]